MSSDYCIGKNDSKDILDAFFLGKAFAEALNERIGSTVGEILSVIGQWQAEQQKQVQDFQVRVQNFVVNVVIICESYIFQSFCF